jgi:hypothetical protein
MARQKRQAKHAAYDIPVAQRSPRDEQLRVKRIRQGAEETLCPMRHALRQCAALLR